MEELKNLLSDNQITNYLVDVSLENGDEIMVKYLIRNFASYPSVCAIETAISNGHLALAKLVNSYYKFRNKLALLLKHPDLTEDMRNNFNKEIAEKFRI